MFPYITMTTAGFVLAFQMLLAFTVSGARGGVDTWIGDGGNDGLQRRIRRHGNLAENGAIFLIGFMLLELSRFSAALLVVLCVTFCVVRVVHAFGLSRPNTRNPLRLAGGITTYLIGVALGGLLMWIGGSMAIANLH